MVARNQESITGFFFFFNFTRAVIHQVNFKKNPWWMATSTDRQDGQKLLQNINQKLICRDLKRFSCTSLQGDSTDHSQGHRNRGQLDSRNAASTPHSLFFFFFSLFPFFRTLYLSFSLSGAVHVLRLTGLIYVQGQRPLTWAYPWSLPSAPKIQRQGG